MLRSDVDGDIDAVVPNGLDGARELIYHNTTLTSYSVLYMFIDFFCAVKITLCITVKNCRNACYLLALILRETDDSDNFVLTLQFDISVFLFYLLLNFLW